MNFGKQPRQESTAMQDGSINQHHGTTYEGWLDVDGLQVRATSSWLSGQQVVEVNGQEVSRKRSFAFNATHTFKHAGQSYRLTIGWRVAHLRFELFRGAERIDLDLVPLRGMRLDPETGQPDYGWWIRDAAFWCISGLVGYTGLMWLISRLQSG